MAGQHPERKYLRTDLAVPANTASSAPSASTVSLGEVRLLSVTVLIPPGHAGLTGIQVRYDNVTLLPWRQDGSWFVGEDIERTFAVGFAVAHGVVVRAFNTDDTYAHTFYVTFEVEDSIVRPALAPVRPLRPITLEASA